MIFSSSIVREIKETAALCHCASVIEKEEGHLICVWYEGAYETSSDTVIRIAHKWPNATEWEPSGILFDFPGVPLGNPVLFSLDNSGLFLIFSLLLAESWKESILCISNSSDSGKTWTSPSILCPRKGFMAKTQPFKLSSGRIVIPLYNDREICPYVMLIKNIDRPLESDIVAETMAGGIAIQPAVVELEPEKLLMLCRTNQETIWRSFSYNGGFSWTMCRPTLLPNPNSAIDLLQTKKGELLLAFNKSRKDRRSLVVVLSEDKGQSWSFLQAIESGEGEYSYPCLIEGAKEDLHLVYTENRYRIEYVQFDLEWLRQYPLSSPLITDEVSE